MILWISRMPPPSHYYAPTNVLRVVVPWMSFDGLLDTAFDQIKHYAAADVAVSLRLIRAFNDIARASQDVDQRKELLRRARRVAAGCADHLPEDELMKLRQRLVALETSVTGSAETMRKDPS